MRYAPVSQGQGATEYLIGLGVVLLIVIVAISIISFSPGTASDAAATESRIYWQGQAKPLRIPDASLVADSRFNFVMENPGAETLTVTAMEVNGRAAGLSAAGSNQSNLTIIRISPGEKITVDVDAGSGSFDCKAGQKGSMAIRIHYTTEYGLAKTETGTKLFVINCNMDSGNGGVGNYTCSGIVEGTCPTGKRCSAEPQCDANGCMVFHCYDETYIGPPIECTNNCGVGNYTCSGFVDGTCPDGQKCIQNHNCDSGTGCPTYRCVDVHYTPPAQDACVCSPLAITTSSIPNGATGTPYSATIAASGGAPAYSWAIDLPIDIGLSYNPQTGAITGNPAYGTACGVVSATVTDSLGSQASASFPLNIECTDGYACQPCVPPPQQLSITTSSLFSGVVGTAYSDTVQATGGRPPYTWSMGGCGPVVPTNQSEPGFYGDPLPDGLSISASGEISGTPQCTYTTVPTFRVTDSFGTFVDRNLSISTTCPEGQMCYECVGCPV